MSRHFEIENLEAQYEEINDFPPFYDFSNDIDPLWLMDPDENDAPSPLVPIADSEDPYCQQNSDFLPSPRESPIDMFVDNLPDDSTYHFIAEPVEGPPQAVVSFDFCPAPSADVVSVPKPVLRTICTPENGDPSYAIEKSRAQSLKSKSQKQRTEFELFDDHSNTHPQYKGWHVVLNTPYGALLAEKKIPVGTIMYARNRLVYVWLPQKQGDKTPILQLGEFNMPASQCGGKHFLCTKRPYSKTTSLTAPPAPSEFFIMMNPSSNCLSNAHKHTESTLELNILLGSCSVATYQMAVLSYDSEVKSKRYLSAIFCMAFLLTGAAGTLLKGFSDASPAPTNAGRVLLSTDLDELDSKSSDSFHIQRLGQWVSEKLLQPAANSLVSSFYSDCIIAALFISSLIAYVKWMKLKEVTRSMRDGFSSGRLWNVISAVAILYLVIWRCSVAVTAPVASKFVDPTFSSPSANLSWIGINLSPISLVVLFFSAYYFMNGAVESPERRVDEDDTHPDVIETFNTMNHHSYVLESQNQACRAPLTPVSGRTHIV